MSKVLLINGSPHQFGCTYTALRETADTLEKNGVETEILYLGTKPIAGCIACTKCHESGRCIFDDGVNQLLARLDEFQGIVIGSPVYYAHPSARLQAVLDRAFYSCGQNFAFKPGAAVVSARRSGTTASFDVINKYFTISNMPVVSSTYWNNIHGNAQTEAEQDAEHYTTPQRTWWEEKALTNRFACEVAALIRVYEVLSGA